MREVVALPRVALKELETLPPGLVYVTEGLNDKKKYGIALLKEIFRRRQKGPNGKKFDLIFCCHINLLPLARLAQLFLGAPMVLAVYGIEAWQAPASSFYRGLAAKIRHVVSISDFTSQRFGAWAGPGKQIHLLPCCVEMERYWPAPPSETLRDRYGLRGRKVIMTLGRLAPEEQYKGFDEILESLSELAKTVPDIAYLVAGDGGDRPRLEAKAERLGVKDRVVFAGRIAEEEKGDHYRLADAYVMPGRGEGFGIVYLEALACGIPVVASKIDGSREAVRNGLLGAIVDPSNPAEMRAAVLKALSLPKGRPEGLDFFSFPNFQAKCHQVLASILRSEGLAS